MSSFERNSIKSPMEYLEFLLDNGKTMQVIRQAPINNNIREAKKENAFYEMMPRATNSTKRFCAYCGIPIPSGVFCNEHGR